MFYVLISGCRDYTDYALFKEILNKLKAEYGDFEIVEGGAKGTDAMAKKYAVENGLKYHEFPAKWNTHGIAAGPIRNAQMVNFVKDHPCRALFFWDGESKGTGNCLKTAMAAGIPYEVYPIQKKCFATNTHK